MKAAPALLAAFALSTGACASGSRLADDQELELYRSHAGAPVQSFRYFSRIDGWTPLGESALAVWTRPKEAWLLEVDGPCPELDFAQAIGLSHQFGRVYARFDRVIPRTLGGGTQPIPCRIRQIRPLDVKALKAAEHDVRAQGEEATR